MTRTVYLIDDQFHDQSFAVGIFMDINKNFSNTSLEIIKTALIALGTHTIILYELELLHAGK